MSRFPLRLRLTVVVTVLFGLALSTAAVVSLVGIESSLRTSTRNNAEALLIDYLDALVEGTIGPGDPAPEDALRFVYVDDQGNDLTDVQYQRILLDSITSHIGDLLTPPVSGLVAAPPGSLVEGPVIVDAGIVEISFEPITPDSEPITLDRGGDVIAIGMSVRVGNVPLTVAVSSPLQPVTDSIDALTRLYAVVVPLLILAMAAMAWLIIGKALRPVDAITAQVDRITTESLDQRVPAPEVDDEIGHLAATMNRMLARLQDARDAQRRFISDASHELRSPITATAATLEVARNQPEEIDWPATAEILDEENVRLAQLVDDLLLLAQLQETGPLENVQEVDLDELCLQEAQRPHPCGVRVHIESPVRVAGDPSTLTRAIRNLVDNAARHANSRVDITTSRNQDSAVIKVADDGPGIPEEDLERVFQRFSRVDSSRNRALGGGAGLGLAIADRIVASHHGTIVASNAPNGGARFTMTIPVLSSNPSGQKP